MAKPNFSLNTNFKVCARIKPLEYTSRMLEVTNDSVVTIRDISNKTNSEKQQFHFNKVFDQSSKQEHVFNYIAENAINKALEGTNSCILSYGQTGAGKSYTMFGDDDKPSPGTINLYSDSKKDKKGIIAKTVEHLLKKNNEMEGVRELILTCSFIEIYLDQVTDLARNYSDRNIGSSNQKRSIGSMTNTGSTYETENLEIYEHANGQVLVRNAKSATIKSVEEVQEMLASGFSVREKSGGKDSQIWSRSHTIFTINIVQKEIENEDLPFPKSMIQFVDLAGSERIAKSITEGQNKFQEAVLIMSHLTSLYKVLAAIATNSKNIPYRDSKLTKILYNCLTPYNNIIILAHLHPAEANFEETLNTLQFVERCKNVDMKDKRGLAGNNSGIEDSNYAAATNASNDKLWKKMTDEIADLKNKIENIQKENRGKLDRIQTYLGLEIDLDKVNSNVLSKEAQLLTQLKNTNVENQNLKATILQTEETFEMMRKEFEDERKEFFHKQSKLESNNVEIREQMRKNTDKLITTRNKDEDDLKRQIQILTEENKKLSAHNTQLLQEKTQALMNFSTNLDIKTRTLNQTMDMKSIGKKEAEIEYKDEVTLLRSDYRKLAEDLKQQYEHWLKLKNEEMDRYAEKAQEYQRRKKEQLEAMKNELLELYGVAQKQEKIIEKVENGGYSGGLRSFFIPSKDKPLALKRQKYPQLYKFLDEKKPELTTQTFFRIRDTTDFYPPFERTALSPPGRTMTNMTMTKFGATMNNTGYSNYSKSADKAKITRPDEVDLDLNINKLHVEDLRRYTDSLKQFCRRLKDSEKELKVQADKYVELNVYGDIHDIIKEKDKYKELYRDQSRKNHDNKIMIESQGRILRSGSKTFQVSKTRPGTSGWE